jgi:hypothetical protein
LQYQNGELKPLWNNTSDSSLGTSTNQWKSVYSQTYYYNGTAWGLDKVNEWTDTNTFSKTNSDTIQLKNDKVAIGETISSDVYTQLAFKDKNADNLAYIRDSYMANGANNLYFYVRNKFSSGSPSTTGSVVYTFFGLSLDNTGKSYARLKGDFYPYTDNLYSLGTSTNKWKAVYSSAYYLGSTAFGDIVTYNAAEFVPRSGGAVLTGDLLASSTTNSIGFGYGWGNGSTIYTYSPTHSTAEWQGTIRLEPLKTTSNFKTMQLAPDGTWTWSGTACQITSDQRYKQQITEIDDKLLDAWGDVELVQFKYNESVDTKGESARLHTGYVVQQIDSACKSHGVDVSTYGLYCHEEYPQETKEVEVEQADGTKTKETKVIREASEHYSLRYTEALIVECKYLRRCIARLTARIEELEKGNNSK